VSEFSGQGVGFKRSRRRFAPTYAMSEATYSNWKTKYSGMTASDLKRLKVLEEENRLLKQLVAKQALDNRALKELLSKNF
jgi:putative transposase